MAVSSRKGSIQHTVEEKLYRKLTKEKKVQTDVKLRSRLHASLDRMGKSGLSCRAIASSVEFCQNPILNAAMRSECHLATTLSPAGAGGSRDAMLRWSTC